MNFAILAAALMLPAASVQQATPAAPPATDSLERIDRMNLFRQRPGCVPIPVQVARPRLRDNGATRLDRLPPGQVLLAVERHVGGCPEAVLLSEERRRTGR